MIPYNCSQTFSDYEWTCEGVQESMRLSIPPLISRVMLSSLSAVANELILPAFQKFILQEGSDITVKIESALHQTKQLGVETPHPQEVRKYLLAYPDITEIVPFICDEAKSLFRFQTHFTLEVFSDPECEDEYLALYIRQEDYDENIMDTIEDICKEYEDSLQDKSGWILVTTDFQPPNQ